MIGPFKPLSPSCFGIAKRCKLVREGQSFDVVVKVPKDDVFDKNLLNEWLTLIKLPEHRHVLKAVGVCDNFEKYGENPLRPYPPRVALVTEYMVNGSIEDLLRESERRDEIAKQHIVNWAMQIASGLAHLHQHKLVHRDVAARNVLLNAKLECLIGDFGLLRNIADAEGKTYYKQASDGALPFVSAPEVLDSYKFSPASDIFSFGVTLFEIATCCNKGSYPLPSLLSAEDAKAALEVAAGKEYKELTDQLPRWCPQQIKELMLKCLAFDARARPTAADIVSLLSTAVFTSSPATASPLPVPADQQGMLASVWRMFKWVG